MVSSSLVTERVEESESVDLLTREDKSVRISREPSFSGWFDEDGIPLPARLRNDEVNEEDFVFRLHLVQPQGSENGVLDREGSSNFRHRMEHGGDTDGASTNGLRKQNESYVPLDIENSHDIDKTYTSSTSSYNRVDYNSPFRRNEENPISVSDVLKTLVLILVWYTFSTFLTLYNKTLLGDDMGKFPAPLLMNTIHFAMQAVLSMGITWFWSDRFHSSVMSWNDYFVRVVPTALSTALDVNLSNASLVFISVTFATMLMDKSANKMRMTKS
ncbi:UNVERIFIED_CONTAM: putative sugar phosphate/phosphate translocator [Sesamum radiatum]|uniref:Sugar phosphate/phosphate translocator n=1 Tax=Sesamum radiatum TaxID=300843 RepID=A0AAW2KLB1_SESRA